MNPNLDRQVARAVRELERDGLLLQTDPKLPSLVALVTEAPVHGSWWSHPLAHTIFALGQAMAENPDVLAVKLVSGKQTWVHRRLWPALLAVASAGEAWQMDGLSAEARALLRRVGREGPIEASGSAARELELRLLVRGEDVHTRNGQHTRTLESWERWAGRVGADTGGRRSEEGRAELELALSELNSRSEGSGRLPWQKGVRRRTRPTSR